MIEAGASSTGEVQVCFPLCVRAPPGTVMFAPPEVPRNASRAQREAKAKGRAWEDGGHHGAAQLRCEHYRGRSPVGPRPDRLGCYSSSRKVISTLAL